MRRLRYQVAASLDGFIAGPKGEFDWIPMDPAVDFAALYQEFDTAVMGRKTFEVLGAGGDGPLPGLDVIVFSRTLPDAQRAGVRITRESPLMPPRTTLKLKLVDEKALSESGIVMLSYAVPGGTPPPPIRYIRTT
jgi:dihydrofolate reductase